ncbi:MAG: hypothetical protein AABM29_06650 [Actinomycetota bacterium]
MSDQAPPGTTSGQAEQRSAEEQVTPPDFASIDDADDLRGFHFRRYMRRRLTWILLALGMIVGFGVGTWAVGPGLGGLAAAAMFLLGLLIAYGVADSASEDNFWDTYSVQRGMTRTEDGSLPPVTELLRKGDEREADEILRGPLADGTDGTLALYTYTEVHHDKNGRHETDYHFTVAMTDLADSLQFVEEISCQRKSGLRALEGLEDAFRTKQRIELESEALDRRYEIFVSKNRDPNWIRQLFSPTFIVWLTEQAPDKFAFELESGVLCCNVKGHRKSTKELDAMRAAAGGVAQRIREEIRE